jgi:signal transduction histidine kinase
LQIQEVDLLKLVNDSVFLAEESASQRDITIRLSAPSEFLNIQADPDRVSQVLDNLLSNAVKFCYPESEIVVVLKAETDRAVISVFNRGDEILKHDQERLFERFYQGNHRQKGLGLGLAIVRHIVEAHGGKVWIESQTGVGNTFYFALPYQHAQNSEEARS